MHVKAFNRKDGTVHIDDDTIDTVIPEGEFTYRGKTWPDQLSFKREMLGRELTDFETKADLWYVSDDDAVDAVLMAWNDTYLMKHIQKEIVRGAEERAALFRNLAKK